MLVRERERERARQRDRKKEREPSKKKEYSVLFLQLTEAFNKNRHKCKQTGRHQLEPPQKDRLTGSMIQAVSIRASKALMATDREKSVIHGNKQQGGKV